MWKRLWGEQAVHTPQVKVQIPRSAKVCFHLTVAELLSCSGGNRAVCCLVELTGPKLYIFSFSGLRCFLLCGRGSPYPQVGTVSQAHTPSTQAAEAGASQVWGQLWFHGDPVILCVWVRLSEHPRGLWGVKRVRSLSVMLSHPCPSLLSHSGPT